MDNEQLKPQSEWYLQFKEISQQMKFDEKQSVFTLNELKFKELKQLLHITVHLVEGGIDFVINKSIDKRLWNIIKSIIEALDRVNFIGPNKVDELKEFYNSIIDLLKQLIKSSTMKVTDLHRDNKHRLFCANLYCYVGEIYEFMEKQLLKENISNPNNFKIAVALYDKAQYFYPYEGKYNYLKASLMIQYQDTFAATYYLLRSLMSQIPFNCKEKLNEVYEMNKIIYQKWAKTLKKSPEVNRDEYMQAFMVYLIKFSSIIYTKIGFEELQQLQGMFELFKEYLQIVRTNVYTDHKNQAEILIKIIQITNFGLHYCFHGGKVVLKCNQDILDNDLVRESIKYVYGIYSNILDFILKYLIQSSTKNVDEIVQSTYLQVVIPMLYYLYDQPLICQHLLSNFNDLNNILSQVYWFARSNLQRVESQSQEDIFKVQEQISEQFHNYLFSFEMPLVGLTLYQHVLKTLKKDYKIIDNLSEEQSTATLFYVSERIIQELSGIKIGPAQEIKIPEQPNNIILQKQLIILDGMNVAIRFGQECRNEQKFYSKGIQVAFDYWYKRGHEVLILLPDFCFSETDLEKKKNSNKNINKLPDDVQPLLKFKQKGYAFGIPNWGYDDSYMIEFGRKKNALIMTNDRYNDHIKTSNIVEREKFKEWIRNNCISFTFIQEELVPDPDFLKKI